MLETDPDTLAGYTDEQWDALLEATRWLRAPWPLVIVQELRPTALFERKEGLDDRRSYILKRLAQGAKQKTVAAELGVTQGLISKILKGERR